EDLVFPSGVTQTSTTNNLSNAVFNSITIAGNNYVLAGNQLTLGNTVAANSGFVSVAQNVTGSDIKLNIQLGGAAGSQQFFNINAGANLIIDGQLSGTTGSTLS